MNQNQESGMGEFNLQSFEMHSVLISPEHKVTSCCASCGREMDFVEGDIIYGEDWYHGNCWNMRHPGAN